MSFGKGIEATVPADAPNEGILSQSEQERLTNLQSKWRDITEHVRQAARIQDPVQAQEQQRAVDRDAVGLLMEIQRALSYMGDEYSVERGAQANDLKELYREVFTTLPMDAIMDVIDEEYEKVSAGVASTDAAQQLGAARLRALIRDSVVPYLSLKKLTAEDEEKVIANLSDKMSVLMSKTTAEV